MYVAFLRGWSHRHPCLLVVVINELDLYIIISEFDFYQVSLTSSLVSN